MIPLWRSLRHLRACLLACTALTVVAISSVALMTPSGTIDGQTPMYGQATVIYSSAALAMLVER